MSYGSILDSKRITDAYLKMNENWFSDAVDYAGKKAKGIVDNSENLSAIKEILTNDKARSDATSSFNSEITRRADKLAKVPGRLGKEITDLVSDINDTYNGNYGQFAKDVGKELGNNIADTAKTISHAVQKPSEVYDRQIKPRIDRIAKHKIDIDKDDIRWMGEKLYNGVKKVVPFSDLWTEEGTDNYSLQNAFGDMAKIGTAAAIDGAVGKYMNEPTAKTATANNAIKNGSSQLRRDAEEIARKRAAGDSVADYIQDPMYGVDQQAWHTPGLLNDDIVKRIAMHDTEAFNRALQSN